MALWATYWINGLLAGLYFLADHWAALGGLGLAALSAFLLDRPQAQLAGERTLRYGRGTTQLSTPTVHLGVLLLGLAWTAAAWMTPPPVPYIGLSMWLAALIAPLALPLGRRHIAHRLRWFIGIYTALVFGFWLLVRFPLSPDQAAAWSERLQSAGAGEALEWSIRAQFIPYIAVLLWAVFPLTYFGYLGQQLAVQRRLLVSPWQSVEARLAELRARGDE